MVNLNSVSSQYNTTNNLYHVNFKAEDDRRTQQPQRRPQQPQTRPPQRYTQQQLQQQEMLRRRLEEAEKQQKKDKRKANLTWALGIGASLAIILSFVLGRKGGTGVTDGHEKKLQEAKRIIIKDVSKEKTLEKLYLPEELQDVVTQLKTIISREEGLKEIGAKTNGGILLYGAPGGGKNAFTYALTKLYQEKYPGSELIFADVNKFKGGYVGDTENTIIGWVEDVLKKAKTNPDKKYIVFMDEFDSIASKSTSGSDTKEGFQNAFKTTLQSLLDTENIQVIAATNKAEKGAQLDKYLDSAIVDRFSRTIHVPMPTKEALLHSFVEHFQTVAPAHRLTPEILDITNPKLNKVCEFIEQNEGSFRIFNAVCDDTKLITEGLDRPTGQPITIQDLVDAMIQVAEKKNWDPAKIAAFKKEISKL